MPGNPLTDPNWAPNLADTVVRVVTSVRDKTTKPLLLISRALVFGIIGLVGGVIAIVLVLVIATRGLQALIEIGTSHRNAVWISYLGVGIGLSLIGFLLMSKRTQKESEA